MGKRKRSGCDKLIDGVQYQHMQGVEGVAKVLEPPGVVTLPAPVEPDGEEGEEGQALLDDPKFAAEEGYREEIAAEELDMEEIEAHKLPQKIPPAAASEEVEYQDGEHTHAVVVRHGEIAGEEARRRQEGAEEEGREGGASLAHLIQGGHQEQGDEKGPQYVLVIGVQGGAGHHQVEGDLCDHRPEEHAEAVAPEAAGVEEALGRWGRPSGRRR